MIAMKLKPTVRLNGIRPEMLLALQILWTTWQRYNEVDMVITSVSDGRHSRGSLHYVGCAVDIRTRDSLESNLKRTVEEARINLGQDFDVVVEKTHLHIEYQPKMAYGP